MFSGYLLIAHEPMRVNQKKIRGRGGRKKEQARVLQRTARAVVRHETRLRQEIIDNTKTVSALQQKFQEICVADHDPSIVTSLANFIRKEVALTNSNIYAYNHNKEKYIESINLYEKIWREELDIKTNKFAFFGPRFEIIYKSEKEFAQWYFNYVVSVEHQIKEVPRQYEQITWWSYPPPENLYSPISLEDEKKRQGQISKVI
tara:strand:+ start:5353 stop:5961 length:609 start_codon:yes stop_codon:yes gene_type:complete